MEIIIFVAVVVVAALLWSGYVKTKKAESDQTIDNWTPPNTAPKTSWPFPGGEVGEGKIHVKVADVAPPAPTPNVSDITAGNKAEAVAKIKKAPAKKAAAKTPRKPKTS